MSDDSENEWDGDAASGDELPGGGMLGDNEPRGSGSSSGDVNSHLPGDGNQGALSNPKYPPPIAQGEES